MTSNGTSPLTPSQNGKGNHNKSDNFNRGPDNDQITFINYTHSYCVCIIDIVNSTENTSHIMGSEQIRKYYSIFLNTMASIIKNYNGKVIKNAGDCLIYYFPKTVNSTNVLSFQDVLDCGLAMIEANPILNSNLDKNSLPPINYRISGNYGKVELAISTNSNNVDLFGPTVNICSKINHLASSNEMVIHKDLYDVIKETAYFNDYDFTEISHSNDKYCSYPGLIYSVQKNNSINEQAEIDEKRRLVHEEIQQNKNSKSNSSFNILLIDDDEDILFTFVTIIESAGYNVASFSDPYQALSHFSQMDPYHYDLVIMDIRMPGLNGIQLYSKFKVMNPDLKVFILSALDAIDELLSIFPEIKSNDILRKPIEPHDLLAKVKIVSRL
ncbi:MAG TPA: response regulator [Phototrophicaceae bacterium]|nr:response regulator [Phototrophicaceae bacterium]